MYHHQQLIISTHVFLTGNCSDQSSYRNFTTCALEQAGMRACMYVQAARKKAEAAAKKRLEEQELKEQERKLQKAQEVHVGGGENLRRRDRKWG